MEIVERNALTVVGLPVRASWQDLWTEMPSAWQRFISRHTEIAHRVGETFVDVSLEKDEDEYLQLVGTQVTQVEHLPQGMQAVAIPAQRYIHHRHVGATKDIAQTFGAMYDWARQEGLAAGDFKLDSGYTVDGDERVHELYVGLRPEKRWRRIQAA